ncbi:ribbon-helix-helix domain-containing protein [Rhodococcus sp. YH3-3]|uniref:ribbon-helix-helix domain-containing protein n=1 Tax=Rhodococcus sp. YH3-3 TaxID=1803579 RepID=UPI0007DB33BE|nr:ribbon-helix-helix domain-containing protein [Rhodococcus sp. YH3-3]
MAEKRFDTNVTIPKSALDRLSEIVRMPGYKSRDQTGRYLILKYIERNEIIPADDRLTHISTVMRHPLPPIRLPNKDIAILDPIVPTRGLKLRLPEGVSGQARSLAFRLPGQAQFRGPSDYQSRLLTDAVMTSIAYECCELGLDPITDPVLANIYPLIRQRAARGLWLLAVNATRTGAERTILREAELSKEEREQRKAKTGESTKPRYVEGVAALLQMNDLNDGEAVWHHAHRYQFVQYLASRLLSTASRHNPKHTEQALYDQHGDHWNTLLATAVTLGSSPRGMKSRIRTTSPTTADQNFEGRGGGAVWRAQRVLVPFNIVNWLSQSVSQNTARVLHVNPPGWQLVLPDGWKPSFFPGHLPDEWAEHVAKRRVLCFDLNQAVPHGAQGTRSRSHMVWPTTDDDTGDAMPVTGLQTMLTALMDDIEDPRKVAEILLLELMPGNVDAGRAWYDRHDNPDLADDALSSNVIVSDDFGPFFISTEPSDELPTVGSATATVEAETPPATRHPGDVPPLPDFSCKTPPKAVQEDTPDDHTEKDRWYTDWRLSDGGASDRHLPVYVPVETAQRLGFIDEAHALRLIDQAEERTRSAMHKTLNRALLEHGQADHDALEKATNNLAQFTELARTLSVEFNEVSAAWCWHVTSISDEAETNPERLQWLATHLAEIYTRELERDMHNAVRTAARQFAYLHLPPSTKRTRP